MPTLSTAVPTQRLRARYVGWYNGRPVYAVACGTTLPGTGVVSTVGFVQVPGCCGANYLQRSFYGLMTMSGGAACSSFNNLRFVMSYDDTTQKWIGTVVIPRGGPILTLTYFCNAGNMMLTVQCNDGGGEMSRNIGCSTTTNGANFEMPLTGPLTTCCLDNGMRMFIQLMNARIF